MMGKRLQTIDEHVTDITISTATVDIQVMRIGTKQMTLAVFRQLPERKIFDAYGKLLAAPWGWVNYDRDGSPAKPFVFSYAGVLYRDNVRLQMFDELIVFAATEEIKEAGHYTEPGQPWVPRKDDFFQKRKEWDEKLEKYRELEDGHFYVQAQKWNVPTGEWILTTNGGYGDIYKFFQSEKDARANLANRVAAKAILASAPQLFIGV